MPESSRICVGRRAVYAGPVRFATFRKLLPLVWLPLCALPLLGAWRAGRDVATLLGFPPPERVTPLPPVSWPALTVLWLIFVAAVFAWWRGARRTTAAKPRAGSPASRRPFPRWGWLALLALGLAWLLAWTRFAWFAPEQAYTFTPLWLAFIVFLNAWIEQRTGAAPLWHETQRFLSLFPLSAVFWWGFEFLNRFAQNWVYPGLDHLGLTDYLVHSSVCFSTVLPAVLSVQRLLASFPALRRVFARGPRLTGTDRRWPAGLTLAVSAGAMLGLGARPDWFFPWLWVAPGLAWLCLEALAGRPTRVAELRRGDWSWWLTWALAALVCGWFWEMWNFFSAAHWAYRIPYFAAAHVFAMPLAGFLGYLPFGVVCGLAVDAWPYSARKPSPNAAGSTL